MQYRIIVPILVMICAAIAVSGCTQPQSPSSVATQGSVSPSSGWSLTTSPTDTMPPNIAVTVTVQEKVYDGTIPVVFNGGKEQTLVKAIDVTLYRSDGQIFPAKIDLNSEASVNLPGSKQTDRVVVYVSMVNGQTYKIADVLSPYRTHG